MRKTLHYAFNFMLVILALVAAGMLIYIWAFFEK